MAASEIILRCWRDHLGLDDVQLSDDFFDLGGSSLLAMRMAGSLADHLGIRVPVRWVFDFPRLADFQRRVAAAVAER
jgi:acyl carrier protein